MPRSEPNSRPSRMVSEVARKERARLGVWDRLGMLSDDLVGVFAPRMGLERAAARAQAIMLRASAFRGAVVDRFSEDWNVFRGDADAAIADALPDLRARSRSLVDNDAPAAALVKVLEENVIGIGLRPQSQAAADECGCSEQEAADWRGACEAGFRDWSRACDVAGSSSFGDIQRQAFRGEATDGEFLVRPVRVPVDADLERREPLALQIIAPERLGDPTTGAFSSGSLTARMRNGVELDEFGVPRWYHIADANPEEPTAAASVKWDRIARFPGSGILGVQHGFKVTHREQHRGVPLLASSLWHLRMLNQTFEAELVRARVEACLAVFIRKSNLGADMPRGFEVDDSAGPSEPRMLQRLRPGRIEYLEEGEEPVPFSPNRPGGAFEPFVKQIAKPIAAACGIPLELWLRDFVTASSYTAWRAALVETRRGFRTTQVRYITSICDPTWRNWIRVAVATGRLVPPRSYLRNPGPFFRVRWIPPPWGWIDQTKEIEASRLAIVGNLSTHAEEAEGAGMDWEEIAETRARELARLRELEAKYNLPPGTLSASSGSAPQAQPNPNPNPQ